MGDILIDAITDRWSGFWSHSVSCYAAVLTGIVGMALSLKLEPIKPSLAHIVSLALIWVIGSKTIFFGGVVLLDDIRALLRQRTFKTS